MEVNPGPSVHSFMKQFEFSGVFFLLHIHDHYTTRKKALISQSKAEFSTSHECVYYVCSLYRVEACVLMCKHSRAACNLFFPFQQLILHDEIKEVK